MTQFNLLPDIKLEYLKAQRNRKLVFSISFIVAISAMILVGLLFSYTLVQKAQINKLASDIKVQGATLGKQANLNAILTIQNQIQTLTTLHEQEPNVTNLATYLNQLIPVTANLSSLSVDFNAHTIDMSGNADNLVTINQLVDIIKFANYTIKGQSGTTPAFSSVVLSSFGVSNQGASYTIDFNFDPTLFDNTQQVTLNIPTKVTTRSQIDQPIQLFNQPKTSGAKG